MKPRKVLLSIEVETDLPLRELRHELTVGCSGNGSLIVHQIQANVVKAEPAKVPRLKRYGRVPV